MFTVGPLYHFTYMVNDLDAVDTWYDVIFNALHIKRSRELEAKRDASFVVIGDVILEAMAVATDLAGAERSALAKFRSRFGEHPHSIAMFVDDLNETCDRLMARGIRLSETNGTPIGTDRPIATQWIWTHPKDTRAQFEFATIPPFHYDPRLHPSWTGDYWRHHPLGIEGLSHLTVLVRDIDTAGAIYCDAFGGEQLHRETTENGHSAYYALGSNVVIEALQPTAHDSPERRDLERCGEGIFGLTLAVRDVARAVDYLDSKHQVIARAQEHSVTLEPTTTFGLGFSFSQRRIPNDRRDIAHGA
jgi:catechol 2,3-dioxygenase-like lactoylglutathione lyase family enzyme